MEGKASPRRLRVSALFGAVLVGFGIGSMAGAEPVAPPRRALDPLAEAIIASLRQPPPRTPRAWLEAAITAADADAIADAADFYHGFVDAVAAVEQDRDRLLADLGDSLDPGGLRRLERALRPYEPDAAQIIDSLRAAARERRRDPKLLAAAAEGLRSASRTERLAAADHLARAGVDALPVLVGLLQTDDEEGGGARELARSLVHEMGEDGRSASLAWLGSDDFDRWPGAIAALAAVGDEDVEFLLAPAFAADSPPSARAAAVEALAPLGIAPSAEDARGLVARRLDLLLSPAGLPAADSLDSKTIETFSWNPDRRLPQRLRLPTRLARAERAVHLARDLAALGPTEPAHIRLVLLARLELSAAAAGEEPDAIDALPAEQLIAALSGPEGFDRATAVDVLDEAGRRGMTSAATAAARAIRLHAEGAAPDAARQSTGLPPAARAALVRALSLPDPQLAFEAAVTLAACGGDPPYRGASQVVQTLIHAATSTGIDRAIVAHPDAVVVEELAAGLSRHGYETIRVRSGRDAILAARDSADTVLVVLAARLGSPSALETVHLLQIGSQRPAPPVLVVVDPLDDAPRGRFLTRLLTSFAEVECVAIVDRMESFFLPVVDPDSGVESGPPRFHDALSRAAGPQAGDPGRRAALAKARFSRARVALDTLAALGARGWDVSAALTTARLALASDDLHAPAVAVLATVGRPGAQQALFRQALQIDLPETLRSPARAGFAASVRRFGILLESDAIGNLAAMYNRPTDAESRRLAGDLLELLEAPRMRPTPARVDAP
jgi:hypothetical protein